MPPCVFLGQNEFLDQQGGGSRCYLRTQSFKSAHLNQVLTQLLTHPTCDLSKLTSWSLFSYLENGINAHIIESLWIKNKSICDVQKAALRQDGVKVKNMIFGVKELYAGSQFHCSLRLDLGQALNFFFMLTLFFRVVLGSQQSWAGIIETSCPPPPHSRALPSSPSFPTVIHLLEMMSLHCHPKSLSFKV